MRKVLAKYYIYRNLHTKTFSVRYKGKVIEHPTDLIARDCIFKVNEKQRQRVQRTKRKNVHAFVVCSSYTVGSYEANEPLEAVYYNPYTTETFMLNNKTIESCSEVYMLDGSCIYVGKNSKQ